VRGKEKERESFLSSVSWVERKREVKRRRRGSMASLKRGGEAMEERERGRVVLGFEYSLRWRVVFICHEKVGMG
jgi:hypothetical protein